MQNLKSIAFLFFVAVSTITILFFNSCKKTTVTDPCAAISCKNGGVCISGTCSCAEGYDGTDCSLLIRDEAVGAYTGTYQYYNGVNYTATITITIAAANGINQITITGVGTPVYSGNYVMSFTTPVTLYAYLDLATKAITIPQQLDANGNNYTGTGAVLSGNELTLSYLALQPSGNGNQVKFTGKK